MSVLRLSALVAAACLALASAQAATTATIDAGLLEGASEDGIAVYRGIPYAAPPVGPLRWQPPQAVTPWQGALEAKEFGPTCLQPARGDGAWTLGEDAMSEDCLYLNVWAPEGAQGLPVMVWIHGGAYRIGAGSLPFYDGARLAPDGVVVVTLNYRLGRFGFFAHPALTAESPDGRVGNYALMDVVAALDWVKRNIAAFGGDAARVTIFGESAGGGIVNNLMVMPSARGLFSAAISESGGSGLSRGVRLKERIDQRPSAEEIGIAFANAAGLPGSKASTEDLRALEAETVLGGRSLSDPVAAGPFVDGTVVPDDIGTLFREGKQARVPYLAGSNSFEASVITTLGGSPEAMLNGSPIGRTEIDAAYKEDAGGDAAREAQLFAGDQVFVSGARYLVSQMAGVGEPAYLYHMTYVPEARRAVLPGVPHGTDVVFVWRAVAKGGGPAAAPYTEADEAMSRLMSGYWIAFAKTHDPNFAGAPNWPAYAGAHPETMILGPAAAPATDYLKARLDLHEAASPIPKGAN
ncbi:MAG: carboxylesterase/lipase family protein [Alphaproteobacteria bacterium]|nr:carboxylesterase/lipase family protein [Alphaproteobacteria bacterium]